MNPMRNIRIEKVTLNFGAGKEQTRLEKGIKLLKLISGKEPVKTFAKKRIPAWGLREGLPIGCKITLRGKEAIDVLKRSLKAKDNKLKSKVFDDQGNFSFGIHEYIDMTDVKYDADIGIIGFEIAVTLERPGFRLKRRKLKTQRISHHHIISKDEAIEYMKKTFNVQVLEA
ncbi:50S ribosomal protein L5 [Candidatus Woesearchaeota archaeon]|nr:50S ribosomal protein L5 [Candidatus Woesearchaeota archaeon]MBW3018220.1 50S ribosomal protein L5 [Candidatus Woesearchaeota archaeon]